MAGHVAYHLMSQAGVARAPWAITTVVSCLPVLVLGMETALAHMLRADAQVPPVTRRCRSFVTAVWARDLPAQGSQTGCPGAGAVGRLRRDRDCRPGPGGAGAAGMTWQAAR